MEHDSSCNKQLKKKQLELCLTKKFKNLSIENPFHFTEYFEKQKEENEIDLGSFFELAEKNKTIYNQTPVDTLIEDMEKLKNGLSTKGFFTLGDVGEIDTNRFFKGSSELAKFRDKILEKYDDHPSINYTGILYLNFRIFQLVTKSEHGGGANELKIILENEGINCYNPSEDGCFLKCINYFFNKEFCMKYFEFKQ